MELLQQQLATRQEQLVTERAAKEDLQQQLATERIRFEQCDAEQQRHFQLCKALIGENKSSAFAVERVLGYAQCGVVFLALSPCGQQVALKMLFNYELSLLPHNAFEEEYQILQRLPYHPHVVQLYSHFVSDVAPAIERQLRALGEAKLQMQLLASESLQPGVLRKTTFVVLEYVPTSLAAFVRTLACTEQIKLQLCADVANGLAFLWRQRVVHRDIKPDNVMVQIKSNGGVRAVIIDFGLAVSVDADGRATVQEPGGNQEHLAPEVLAEFKHKEAKTQPVRVQQLPTGRSRFFQVDYSKQASFEMGVLAVQVFTGQHPFEGYPLRYRGERLDASLLRARRCSPALVHILDQLLFAAPERLTIDAAAEQLTRLARAGHPEA